MKQMQRVVNLLPSVILVNLYFYFSSSGMSVEGTEPKEIALSISMFTSILRFDKRIESKGSKPSACLIKGSVC